MNASLLPRFDVLGTTVSFTSYDEVFQLIDSRLEKQSATVAFCNVHSVMSARRDKKLQQELKGFDVTAPDGIPLVWTLRHLYHLPATRVYGPSFMRLALTEGQEPRWRHFFLGATEQTLERLRANVLENHPHALLVGEFAPPFRKLTESDMEEMVGAIRDSDATVVWVGMGMPKQELLIPQLASHLPGRAFLGVGAAFDLLAGNQPEAPNWMQSRGLEWLYRLVHEPRRLWRRYLVNNPLFLVMIGGKILRSRLQRTQVPGL